MKRILFHLLFIALIVGCTNKEQSKEPEAQRAFNKELADEIAAMYEVDQTAAGTLYGKYKELGWDAFEVYKDSVFTTHKVRLEEIFDEYGYPGIDLVGEAGEKGYWNMVQHCDFDPEFQEKVLEKLAVEVKKNNANSRNFGLLTDRVRLNTGRKQVYGTQMAYDRETGQAYPRSLEAPETVNERRAELGFEPIEEYLNFMSSRHFEINKEVMLQRGITEPKLYDLELGEKYGQVNN